MRKFNSQPSQKQLSNCVPNQSRAIGRMFRKLWIKSFRRVAPTTDANEFLKSAAKFSSAFSLSGQRFSHRRLFGAHTKRALFGLMIWRRNVCVVARPTPTNFGLNNNFSVFIKLMEMFPTYSVAQRLWHSFTSHSHPAFRTDRTEPRCGMNRTKTICAHSKWQNVIVCAVLPCNASARKSENNSSIQFTNG